jgi:transcriptional regulator with XRE-family HTH domain
MSFSNSLWNQFVESKEFREEYVAALAKRAFAHQVRAIRKGREMSQQELAAAANIEQGVISRAENPNYGNLTFNTGFKIAAGFDLAFIPQIVTYSEFLKWAERITEGIEVLPSFEKERENRASEPGELSRKKPSENVRASYVDPRDLAVSGEGNQRVVEITVGRIGGRNKVQGESFREQMERGSVTA